MMWCYEPSIFIGLHSTETESKPFSLPRSRSGQGYYICCVSVNGNKPDHITLQTKTRDESNPDLFIWQDVYKWEPHYGQKSQYDVTVAMRDNNGLPRIFGGEKEYRLQSGEKGVIVYFTETDWERYGDQGAVKKVVDYLCVVKDTLDRLESLEPKVEGNTGRIEDLEADQKDD